MLRSRCLDDKKPAAVIWAGVTNVIAHRGVAQAGVENTVDAFRAAVTLGCDGIELDVRRTSDGALVVHHDARLADGTAIVDHRAEALSGWIPTLALALDACAGANVNLEIKNLPNEPDFDPGEMVARSVMDELTSRPEPASNWLISSFRIESVDRCRAIDGAVPTAWLTAAPVGPSEVGNVAGRGHLAIHPWVPMVDADLIDRCHQAGLIVNTWTCNDPDRAVTLAGWGIDGICTDKAADIMAALRADRRR